MKKIARTFINLWLILPLMASAQKFNSKTVVPKSLAQYSFGMPLEDFTRKNKSATTIPGNSSFRIEYVDKAAGDDIKQVTYYFDAENNQPLYEMIVQFNNPEGLEAHCSKKLGKANDGKQWKWTTREGHIFKAWRFGNTLVLALGLPSTEWEKDWDN